MPSWSLFNILLNAGNDTCHFRAYMHILCVVTPQFSALRMTQSVGRTWEEAGLWVHSVVWACRDQWACCGSCAGFSPTWCCFSVCSSSASSHCSGLVLGHHSQPRCTRHHRGLSKGKYNNLWTQNAIAGQLYGGIFKSSWKTGLKISLFWYKNHLKSMHGFSIIHIFL